MRPAPTLAGLLLLLAAAPAPTGAEPPAPPDALRVVLAKDALVRVDGAAIRARAPGWKVEDLTVTRAGRPVPLAPAAGDALRFVAAGTRGRRATFEIRPRRQGEVRPEPATVQDDREVAVERFAWDRDQVFGAVASWNPAVYDRPVPRWWLSHLRRGGEVALPVALPAPGAVADATVTVRVEAAATHEGAVTLAARWGSTDLGTQTVATAAGGASFTFTCKGADAPTGDARLAISDRTPSLPKAPADDVSDGRGDLWVDAVVVQAPMQPRAGPRWVVDGVRAPLEEVDASAALQAAARARDPVMAAAGADLVVLSTEALRPGAERLAAHRTKHGVRAAVVPASWVWDARGGGEADAEVLRGWIRDLAAATPAPRFVLLCGDAALDRGDAATEETIPTAYVNTKYNGATASDRALAVPDGGAAGGPAVGRLPFSDPKVLDAYVDRVIRYETAPPADATRRLLRFVTSEGRFGPLVDSLIERTFVGLVADDRRIPYDFDVEVTFASVKSPFCWPPAEFNDKVIGSLNEGALFYTYVGHGHATGFDWLHAEDGKRHPILRSEDAPRVAVKGTPPALFVLACTTALFDLPGREGVGEILLERPDGPVAYWGATRICHPMWNSMVGAQLASGLFADPSRRLGEIVAAATDAAATGPVDAQTQLAAALFGLGRDLPRLRAEGAAMYEFLGDPALKVAYPVRDLAVAAVPEEGRVTVTVTAPFPDGTEVGASLEVRRDVRLTEPAPVAGSADPARTRRENHARANDKAVWRGTARAAGGKAAFTATVPPERAHDPLFAKAWAVFGDDVHVGSAAIPAR